MRLVIYLSLFVVVSWLTSCSNNEYSSIPENSDLAITINIKDMTISFVDLEKQEKINQWEMEKPYIGGVLLPDGDSLLLYGKQVETVDVFSLKEGKEIESWNTGKGLANARLLSDKKTIAFADQSQNAVRIFDLEGKEKGKVKTGRNPLTLIESEDQKNLFIISFNDKQLTVIDMKNKLVSSQFPIHASAAGALLLEEKNELWIGGHGVGEDTESDIRIYDSITGEPKKEISAPIMPINFLEKDDHIFVLSHGSSTLYKLNGEGKVMGTLKVGANPFEMIIAKEQMIVAGYDSNDIHIVDSQSLKIQKSIPVGKGPFQIILRER